MEYFTIASLVQSGEVGAESFGEGRGRVQRERRRDAEEAQSSLPRTGSGVECTGQPEGVILTRRRGDAEEEAEKHQESQSV